MDTEWMSKPSERRRATAAVVLVAAIAAVAALSATPAAAATFIVNSTLDAVDASLDGVCATGGDGTATCDVGAYELSRQFVGS